MNTTLVVMAAGIGSRFGQGIKQLTPVGPNGEIIIDYSIHDAIEAGFNKVIFIIRKDIEKEFKEVIGDRISKVIPTEYAFQEKDNLPDGRSCPIERTKPWGTGQAVLSIKGMVDGPFAVINADDYYGKEGFKLVHDYMVSKMDTGADKMDMSMAGFILKNTLSENGGVTRGVCTVQPDGKLATVTETFEISMNPDGTMKAQDEDGHPVTVSADQVVSMNMWGLPVKFLDVLETGFAKWLKVNGEGLKTEYLLPSVIDECIKNGSGTVEVLTSHDKWFGVTYQADREAVINSIKKLVENGVYPTNLY